MTFEWNAPQHIDGNACVHPDDMRAWEAAEISRRPNASQAMMEVAGRAVAMATLKYKPTKALVFCGSGNNGGDGLVAAHYLRNAGCDVHIFAFDDAVAKSPDARSMFVRVQDLPRSILRNINDVSSIPMWKDHVGLIVVDAIFGTGYHPTHSSLMSSVYQCIEELHCPIISVDIASGIDASTGFRGTADDPAPPRALHATETITFGAPKLGHFCGEGPQYTGKLTCIDIGLGPWPKTSIRRTILSDEYVANKWPATRCLDVHKGTCGHVFVIGGSEEMPGAASLASRAALRAGAGLVTLASSAILNTPDEIMRTQILQNDEILEDKFNELLQKADVILMGPGLGRTPSTIKLLDRLTEYTKTLILDADALWALAQLSHENTPKFAERDVFLTPHLGEAAQLSSLKTSEVARDPGNIAIELSKKFHATVILKSHVTHIASPKPSLSILPYPNSAMASAGIGDVLAGILAAIASQARGGAYTRWLDAEGIAAVAVSTHSKAGRIVALQQSTLCASDLIQNIHV